MSPQLQASSLASLTNNNKKSDTKLVSKNEKTSQNCIGYAHEHMSFQCYLQDLISMQGKIVSENYLTSRVYHSPQLACQLIEG
jgi:hypothetical protein